MTKEKKELISSILFAILIFFTHIWICKRYDYYTSCITFFILYGLVFNYKKNNNDLEKLFFIKDIKFDKVFISLFVLWITYVVFYPYFSQPIIGHIFEKDNYKTVYYVNLFPQSKVGLNYRLPAEIQVRKNCDEECYRIYSLQRVYFDNNTSLDFESEPELEQNKSVVAVDNTGREWLVELTDVKVKKHD